MIKTTTAKRKQLTSSPCRASAAYLLFKVGKIGTFPKFPERKIFIVWQFLRSVGIKKKIMIIMYNDTLTWFAVADPAERPGGPRPHFFRPNRGPNGGKNLETEPPLSQNLDDCQSSPPPPPASSGGLDPPLI